MEHGHTCEFIRSPVAIHERHEYAVLRSDVIARVVPVASAVLAYPGDVVELRDFYNGRALGVPWGTTLVVGARS